MTNDTTAATQTIGPDNIAVAASDTLSSGPSISGTLAADREAHLRTEVAGAVLRFLTPGLMVTLGTEELYTLYANYKAASFAVPEGLRKIEAEIGRRYLREQGHEI